MTTLKRLTASDLKRMYLAHNPDGHFFDTQSMRFFGDTMGNFGVRIVRIGDKDLYELYRKRPVKHDLARSYFFEPDKFKVVFI